MFFCVFAILILSPLSQDSDAVAPVGEDDVPMLKRAITKGDNETIEQLLDKGKYSLHFLYDTLALNFLAVGMYLLVISVYLSLVALLMNK